MTTIQLLCIGLSLAAAAAVVGLAMRMARRETPRSGVDSAPMVATSQPTLRRTPKRRDALHINDLLDDLDLAFNALSRADDSLCSIVDADTRAGLRAVGLYVPPRNLDIPLDELIVPTSLKRWPALIFVATTSSEYDTIARTKDNVVPANFMYAKKLAKPSWRRYAPHGALAYYEFGASWHDDKPSGRYRRHAGKLMWRRSYIAIASDGSVRPIKFESYIKLSPSYGHSFVRRQWTYGDMATGFKDNREAHSPDILIGRFIFAYNLWAQKDDKWIVSARKRGQRMMFGVNRTDTARYFRKRDRKVLVNGRLRPIIHYVREHTRITGNGSTVVKEHIRGQRAFDWNGYACAVTAPDFHPFVIDNFTAGAITADTSTKPCGHLSLVEAATFLANAEDNQASPQLAARQQIGNE